MIPARNHSGFNINSSKVTKKRTTLVCHRCQRRKTKCDLAKSGPPCHNCCTVGAECTPSSSHRRRHSVGRHEDEHGKPSIHSTASTPIDGSHNSLDCRPNAGNTTDMMFLPIPNTSKSSHPYAMPATPESSTSFLNLPLYIKSPQRKFKPHEIECLTGSGALSIPDHDLRDELLHAFILYAYPFLPVFSLQRFLSAIDGESDQQISLIMFQVVMFAGTAFVDLEHLLNAGFANRLAAREYFYEKVKVSMLSYSRCTSILTVLIASLRFRMGNRPYHFDSNHPAPLALVCRRESPKGPMVLDGHWR
jgi:hypothetical protein